MFLNFEPLKSYVLIWFVLIKKRVMHEWDSEGQRLSSIDLDTYLTPKQPYIGIKTNNKISVL